MAPVSRRRRAVLTVVVALALVVGLGVAALLVLRDDSDDSDDSDVSGRDTESDVSDLPSSSWEDQYNFTEGLEDYEYADPQGDYDKKTDTHTLPSGIVVKSPGDWVYYEDTFTVRVENQSFDTVTPYFQFRMVNESETHIFTTWDCYGDTLGPGVSERVECFGEGTGRRAYILVIDESLVS